LLHDVKAMNTREKKKERKKQTRKDRSLLDEDEGGAAPAPAASAPIPAPAPAPAPVAEGATESAVSTGKKCNTCGGSFESDADYRTHFR
jgi:hypothetical protein